MPNSLVQVAFHDAQVVCVMHDGKPFVALRPLCDALEIAWEAQFRAIKKDPVLTSVVDELSTTGADGKRYSMLCLPLDYLNGWLFKIDAGRYSRAIPAVTASSPTSANATGCWRSISSISGRGWTIRAG